MLSDSKINNLLYRIIKGRLRLRVGDLYLIINEPSSDLIEESFFIYEDSYEAAYLNNCLTKDDLIEQLIEHNLWTPLDDKEIERLQKESDDLRVECFQSFFKKDALRNTKRRLNSKIKEIEGILNKKHALDFLSCEYIAENARQSWLVSQCCLIDNKPPDWEKYDFNTFFSYYKNNIIPAHDIRAIARSNYWRPIWNASRKMDLFNRPATELTRDQLTLCSYSSMYDNAYEHQEAPCEDIMNDDDCLDGWFIFQKRKYEKDKRAQETENLLNNPKIKNAKEVFIMAKTKEDANSINGLNDTLSSAIIQQRKQTIKEKGSAKDTDFIDVQTEIHNERQQKLLSKMRGK